MTASASDIAPSRSRLPDRSYVLNSPRLIEGRLDIIQPGAGSRSHIRACTEIRDIRVAPSIGQSNISGRDAGIQKFAADLSCSGLRLDLLEMHQNNHQQARPRAPSVISLPFRLRKENFHAGS
jgi:hypothetical protein